MEIDIDKINLALGPITRSFNGLTSLCVSDKTWFLKKYNKIKILHKLRKDIISDPTIARSRECVLSDTLNHVKNINVHGPDAFTVSGEPVEYKTEQVSFVPSGKRVICLSGRGTFNDVTTQSKWNKIKSGEMKFYVAGFVDHRLVYACEIPLVWPDLLFRLEKQFNHNFSIGNNSINPSFRRCLKFSNVHWLNCPTLNWEYIMPYNELQIYQHRIVKKLRDKLIGISILRSYL